jgi:hypothetical protein
MIVDLGVDPEMTVVAIGIRTVCPSSIALPVASALRRWPKLVKSLRNEKRTKPVPKIATHASTIFSILPSGSRIANNELATATTMIR